METIFSVPMRTNNGDRYESGDRRLGDIIDFAIFDHITVKIGIDSIQAGDSILVSYTLLNSANPFLSQDILITEAVDHYFDFAASDIGPDTMVNGIIHTNGRARYSVNIVAMESGEDYPGRPEDPF